MMTKLMKIKKDGLDFQFYLIYDSVFQQGAGNLDYLHFLRQPSYIKFPWCHVKSLEESRQKYEEYVKIMPQNILNYFQQDKNASFMAQAIVRPPTNRPELQKPVFDIFYKVFPGIADLSNYLSVNLGGKGIKKFLLSKNIDADLNKIERILIIDDVYAEGDTIASIMFNLRREKSFIAVCPLFVEQNYLFSGLRHATDELLKKLKLKKQCA